ALLGVPQLLQIPEDAVVEVERVVLADEDLGHDAAGLGDQAAARLAEQQTSGRKLQVAEAEDDFAEVALERNGLVAGIWRREAAADVERRHRNARSADDVVTGL